MTKKTLTAKVSPKTLERLEEYAEKEGISKSESTDRLLKQGLDVEESDMRLIPVKSDGGTKIEHQLDEIDNQIDEFSESLEKQSIDNFLLNGLLVTALAWLAVEVTIGFGAFATIVSGIALMGSMTYMYFQVTGDTDE